MRVHSPAMPSPYLVRSLALLVLFLAPGCTAVRDLLEKDERPDHEIAERGALAPPPAANPAAPRATPPADGLAVPDGLTIPLPGRDSDTPEPPARGSLSDPPPGSVDPRGNLERAFLVERAQTIHRTLVAALDPQANARVRSIALEVVDQPEPNAAAACVGKRRTPLMMITSAMLEVAAGIAETTAYDELAGTATYTQHVATLIERIRRNQSLAGVDPDLHAPPHARDPHKLARQLHLYDQQLAFIIGHELAHHHRGHTNCVTGRSPVEVQRDELVQLLAHTVPPFSQPREVEADLWGVANVLEAGHERPGGAWTEEGALLNMDFFRRLSDQRGAHDQGGAELVLAFLSTHPPAMLRIPIVRATAAEWRPGWRPPSMPTLGEDGIELNTPSGPLRLPTKLPIDPSQLPFPFPLLEPR